MAVGLAVLSFCAGALCAETPKVSIRTKNGLPMEEQRKAQMLRLAKQYDLAKYTITRDILIERGAVNHSFPVLTLTLRFLDDDDLALSAYVHEQGHWVLMERDRADNPRLFEDLLLAFAIWITASRKEMVKSAAVTFTLRFACSSGRPWKT